MRIPALSFLFGFSLPIAQAHAHLGHLGEVAGHSHWIALGAAATAAAIAAWIGKRKLDAQEAEDDLAEEAPEVEAEPTEA